MQIFLRVTAPLIMPATLFVLVNALIGAFRFLDHVIVLTKGGPDYATMLLLFYIYETGFQYWDTGYAAALGLRDTILGMGLPYLASAFGILLFRPPAILRWRVS